MWLPRCACWRADNVIVKVCGLTSLDDALAAVEAGADMLGFNFYERSPRYVSPVACARIQAGLQAQGVRVTTVGVFVNAGEETIRTIMAGCNLDLAQLHGDEAPELLRALGDRAYKAIRPADLGAARELAARYVTPGSSWSPVLLVDAARAGHYGGTGQVADWDLARALAREPILLAGGLCPENVADAIRQVRPWGVDVASGVESAPGKKDRARMVAFVSAACRQR
jgi:phosphoribosylanthranilate isomerase